MFFESCIQNTRSRHSFVADFVMTKFHLNIPVTVVYSHRSNWKWSNSKLIKRSTTSHSNFMRNECFDDTRETYRSTKNLLCNKFTIKNKFTLTINFHKS